MIRDIKVKDLPGLIVQNNLQLGPNKINKLAKKMYPDTNNFFITNDLNPIKKRKK